jgi:hypothetical protein
MTTTRKQTLKQITPSCSVCGKKVRMVVHPDGTPSGGYYFGKIPLYRKSEKKKSYESGTHKSKIGSMRIDVFNYDPKPYAHEEYWECPTCYRKQKPHVHLKRSGSSQRVPNLETRKAIAELESGGGNTSKGARLIDEFARSEARKHEREKGR